MNSELNLKKTRLINFKLLIVIFLIIYNYRYFRDLKKGWIESFPATSEIFPPVQYLRGFIQNDLLAKSLANGPASHAAKLLNFLLPENDLEMINKFIDLDKLLFAISISLIIFIISHFVSLISVNSRIYKKNYDIKYQKNIYNLNLVISTIIFFISHKVFKVLGYKAILNISRFGWSYPINTGPNSSGISLIFILISILIPILLANKFLNIKSNKIHIFYIFSIFNYLLSVYFHPQLPLGIFIILLPIRFLFLKEIHIKKFWDKTILVYLFIWITNAVIVSRIYSYDSVLNNVEFFKIYVETKSPIHYLPSYFLDKNSLYDLLLNIFIILFLYLISIKFKIKDKGNIFKIYLIGFISTFLIVLMQYIFVEIFKIPIFIKLGVSRFSYSYGFFFISAIVFSSSKIIGNYLELIYYKHEVIKYPKKIINRLFLILIILLSINLLFQMKLNYNRSRDYILNNPSSILSSNLIKNNLNNNNIIFLDYSKEIFKFPRIFGKINLYHDKEFPFDIDAMKIWYDRKNTLHSLLNCNNQLEKEDCFQNIKENNIIFISKFPINSLKEIDKFNIEEETYYVLKK